MRFAFALRSSFCATSFRGHDEALRDTEIIKVCSLRGMDLRVSVEPQQGPSYDDVVRVAKAADELGFDGFFRSDHYLAFEVTGCRARRTRG